MRKYLLWGLIWLPFAAFFIISPLVSGRSVGMWDIIFAIASMIVWLAMRGYYDRRRSGERHPSDIP